MATVFYTGCSLDGFIAAPGHDLGWLTSRQIDGERDMGFETFRPAVGAAVMGANTWQWLLDAGETGFAEGIPAWVLTHRPFDPAPGVTFAAADDPGELRGLHAELLEAAGGKHVWLVGGGAMVAAFAEVGLVDEFWVQFAPVTLGSGAPLCPAHVELRLLDVVRNEDFACTRYAVVR